MASATHQITDVWGRAASEPFDQAALGDMLNPWIRQHGESQQDAAEFAGWFRAQLFVCNPDDQISAGWQKCLLQSTEDQGSVIAPLLLTQKEQQPATLQELIDEWHACDPLFVPS